MKNCYVVDTNVPIVANGETEGGQGPSVACRSAAIAVLQKILRTGIIAVDLDGRVQTEYRTYLSATGQPGVGDRFYQEVLHSSPTKIIRVDLPMRADGEYVHLPQPVIDAGFDPSDRKFAALAIRCEAPVLDAVDSDWLHHRELLAANGISVEFVCGCNPDEWFAA